MTKPASPSSLDRHAAQWLCRLVSAFALLTSTVMAQTPVAAYRADYDLYRDDDKVGESSIQLSRLPNEQWQFETRSQASLLFMSFSDQETSRFVWQQDRPLPLQFDKQRSRPGKTERINQQFNWETKTDSGSRGKKNWSTPLADGTHDLQSHLLALQLDLRAGKKEMHYPVSKHGRVRDYHYKVIKEEVLETALGKLPTLRVERIRDPDDDRQTISWLAPSLDYVAVRIQQFEEGELQGDMQIRKLTR